MPLQLRRRDGCIGSLLQGRHPPAPGVSVARTALVMAYRCWRGHYFEVPQRRPALPEHQVLRHAYGVAQELATTLRLC